MMLDSTQLVVLSACETGLGRIVYADGVYGLQRAFILSGVKSLITTHWKVDDNASGYFMVNFYSGLFHFVIGFKCYHLTEKNATTLMELLVYQDFQDMVKWKKPMTKG